MMSVAAYRGFDTQACYGSCRNHVGSSWWSFATKTKATSQRAWTSWGIQTEYEQARYINNNDTIDRKCCSLSINAFVCVHNNFRQRFFCNLHNA